MKHKPLHGLLVLTLLATPSAFAEVPCANKNPAIPATTPTIDFTANDNGTATHTSTGLMWMRCSIGQIWDGSTCIGTATTHTWQGALQLVADINSDISDVDNDGAPGFAGHTDWRLPNRNELKSIIDESCWSPAINAAVFPGAPSSWFWSSSPYADDSAGAWGVYFDDGHVGALGKINPNYARLVRAGQ